MGNIGRTPSDLLAENKWLIILLLILIIGAYYFAIEKGYDVDIPVIGSIVKNGQPAEENKNDPQVISDSTILEDGKPSSEIIQTTPRLNKKKENIVTFQSSIIDSLGTPIAGVEIFCSDCVEKNIKSDNFGNILLKRIKNGDDFFETSSITLKKETTNLSRVTIYWRDKSPNPIIY